MKDILHSRCLAPCVALLVSLLAGCTDVPQPQGSSSLSFTQTPPIELDVMRVDITEEYQPSLQPPHVEQFFPIPPMEAMKIWARDRIRPIGGDRTLEVIIKDASVVQKALPRTKGLEGVFTKDQADQYDVRLEVEMRIYGRQSALSESSIRVVATRSNTIGEDASVVDRDRLFSRMTRELMQTMDAELEKNILAYFGNYIHFSDSPPR